MTDRPKTMMLSATEWRALVYAGASGICNHVNMMAGAPSREQVVDFHETLDRLKMQVSAWAASGQPQPFVPDNAMVRKAGADIEEGDPVMTNGTGSVVPAGPKKKRGWQKGRKRGPRKPKGNEAVQ